MGADRRMADSVDRLTRRVDRYTAGLKRPHAELRQEVHDLAAKQWGPPEGVVHLGEVGPAYAVPGRRKDGTVKGKRLVRRFFWNIGRGVFGAVMNVFMLVSGGGMGNVLQRDGAVRGPADAQALGLVDAARPAKSAWLVHAKSYVAVVDSGPDVGDPPAASRVLWHAAGPDAPRIVRGKQLVAWADGSEFQYRVSADEIAFPAQERRSRLR